MQLKAEDSVAHSHTALDRKRWTSKLVSKFAIIVVNFSSSLDSDCTSPDMPEHESGQQKTTH